MESVATSLDPREQELLDELFSCDSVMPACPSRDPDTSIPGLVRVRQFLDAREQQALLAHLEGEGVLLANQDTTNQAMRFYGTSPLPEWLQDISDRVRDSSRRQLQYAALVAVLASTASNTTQHFRSSAPGARQSSYFCQSKAA